MQDQTTRRSEILPLIHCRFAMFAGQIESSVAADFLTMHGSTRAFSKINRNRSVDCLYSFAINLRILNDSLSRDFDVEDACDQLIHDHRRTSERPWADGRVSET